MKIIMIELAIFILGMIFGQRIYPKRKPIIRMFLHRPDGKRKSNEELLAEVFVKMIQEIHVDE